MSPTEPRTAETLKRLWQAGPSKERDNLVNGIARYVSKNADLSFSHDVLRHLNSFFTVEDSVELYVQIRDLSQRLEEEWRDAFVEYFPDCSEALPPRIA